MIAISILQSKVDQNQFEQKINQKQRSLISRLKSGMTYTIKSIGLLSLSRGYMTRDDWNKPDFYLYEYY